MGALKCFEPLTDSVERFFVLTRFEQRNKLSELPDMVPVVANVVSLR